MENSLIAYNVLGLVLILVSIILIYKIISYRNDYNIIEKHTRSFFRKLFKIHRKKTGYLNEYHINLIKKNEMLMS